MSDWFSRVKNELNDLLRGLGVATPEEHRRTCVHESGHVIVAWSSTYVTNIKMISVDRDCNSGYTDLRRLELDSQHALWSKITIDLAGIAAEGIVLGSLRTAEAEDDLLKARASAEQLVAMANSPLTTPWPAFAHTSKVNIANTFVCRPSLPVSRVLNLAYHKARQIITARRDSCNRLIAELHAKPVLHEQDLSRLFGKRLIYELLPRTAHVFILPNP